MNLKVLAIIRYMNLNRKRVNKICMNTFFLKENVIMSFSNSMAYLASLIS